MAWSAGFAFAFTLLPAAAGALVRPNARLTPGALETSAPSATRICTSGYARTVRHRYDATWLRYRAAMFRAYGIPHVRWRDFTVDHLIPIELGGRAFGILPQGGWDLRNVWPQPKSEAKRKDAVEDALHAAVCRRHGYHGLHVGLADAEHAIATDWSRTPVGLPRPRARAARRSAGRAG